MQLASEDQFRAVLLVGMALFVPVGAYFRWKSHTGEKLDRRQEGWFILISLRLVALLAAVGIIAYLINPASMKWSAVEIPAKLRLAGALFGLLGGALAIWTFRHLGANLTDTVVTRRQHSLITSGPYRWVRHPFYGAGALLFVSVALLTANVFIFVSGILILSLLIARTKKEERNLLQRFGEDYRNYMRRTGRFIPRPRMKGFDL